MTNQPSRSHPRAQFRSLIPVAVVCLALALGLLASGCGSTTPSDTSASTAAAGGSTTSLTGSEATSMSGGELGQAAAALWAEATQRLNTVLEGMPSVDDVKDDVAALKEEYVQKLIALGKARRSMDASAKAQADSAIASAFSAAADEVWYTTYLATYDEYAYQSGDVDFVNLLGSFNILTQYADFELLKQQEPDEATRLGIE